ncbi:MAG: hypothetical protein HY079_07240 [Elusimicrobia bacterium]|nr:hypothetical protein [Elusimicrobiota bacterium]
MRPMLLATGLILAGLWGARAARANEGSCVDCHRKTSGAAALAHDFKDWETSAHGRAAVACEACHGGNPLAQDKAQAHAGVLRSTDKKSPLYFTEVPETCGTCHKPELDAFKSSAHYKELHRTGQGPNCVTCHGAMANHVIAPRDMEMTCTLCHRNPTKAYSARMALDSAASMVKRLEKAIAQAKAAGTATVGPEASLADARKLLADASIQWHTFDTAKVIETTSRAKRSAGGALKELEPVKAPAKAPAKKRP